MTGGAGGSIATAQCTDTADRTTIMGAGFEGSVIQCGQMYIGQEPQTLDCMKMIGLSDGCAQCYDDEIHCIIMNCLNECINDVNSQMCVDCRAMFCDPPLAMCTGL